MTSKWTCTKVENCFANAKTYEYRLAFPVTEEWLSKAAESGTLRVKKNFRRPCYFLDFENGTQMKGNLNENRMKVSYPESDFELQKEKLEQQLKEWIK